MIPITKAEQKEIRKLFPQAAIQRTKHRAYMVPAAAAVSVLYHIRGEEPPQVRNKRIVPDGAR